MDKTECRRELGLPDDAFVIGYAGRLVPEKGLDEIFTAFESCPPNTHLVMLGSGPMQEPLTQRAQVADMMERLHFVSDVPLTDVPHVMNAMDVFVLMSRTTESWKEQFGRVIIEAHACRVPVVGSSSGAIPEVVGDAGRIVPEGDTQALIDALLEMHADPDLRTELGLIGRQRVEDQFTWGRVAERMAAIYQRVAQQDCPTQAERAAE
jgi:glycosyltransferase involved in cell wall biosynthesis